MRDITLSDKNILIYRIIFAALSWFFMILSASIYAFNYGSVLPWFNVFKSFSYQTNLIITIWLTLAIVWHNKPESLERITGLLKGAFTMYITITFVVFAVLLSPFSQPTGFAAFNNLVIHYIIPIAFIVDWVLTETKMRYKWSYLPYWILYPLCYIVFAVIHGTFTGNYVYYFLDISALGFLVFFLFVSVLIVFGIALGCLYIWINRKRTEG
ncbi:MAG: Pr6Pr family membrane protein [Candidatus Lokiarchaeota archaeon]|nr:Pr6Pr family membrane protein [Candidatus Lokiarchaeota archaeon]